MPANLTCPECAAVLKIPTMAVAGKKIRCPSCNAVFSAPEDDEPPAVLRASRRSGWDRDDEEDEADEFAVPRRRGREGNSGVGWLIGLGVAAALVLLTLTGSIGALLWYRAARGRAADVNRVVVQAPAAPAAERNVPAAAAADRDVPVAPPPPHNAPAEQPDLQHAIPDPPPAQPQPQPQPQPDPQPRNEGRWTGGMRRFPDDQILTVIVTDVRDGNVGKYVLDKLASQLPRDNASTRSFSSGGVMRVALAPVGNPQAFAAKIDFGTVTRIDGRVVHVTVKDLNLPPPGASGGPPQAPAAGSQ
jgi:predicted Zn finger-like uncharacterized protein